MTEQEFGQAVASAGGRAYIVGGWVRDYLMGRNPHDKDYVITGLNQQLFHYAPFHWAVGAFQCTRFERDVVVAFYFRLILVQVFRRWMAISARPEQHTILKGDSKLCPRKLYS